MRPTLTNRLIILQYTHASVTLQNHHISLLSSLSTFPISTSPSLSSSSCGPAFPPVLPRVSQAAICCASYLSWISYESGKRSLFSGSLYHGQREQQREGALLKQRKTIMLVPTTASKYSLDSTCRSRNSSYCPFLPHSPNVHARTHYPKTQDS